MSIEIKKPAIDIGIVARDIDAMLNFYGEVIGLELEAAISNTFITYGLNQQQAFSTSPSNQPEQSADQAETIIGQLCY